MFANNDFPPSRKAVHLETTSRGRIWLGILLAVIGVACAENAWSGVGISALFILVTCGASWILGGRTGYLVAAATSVFVIMAKEAADVPPLVHMAKDTIRVITLMAVAGMVSGFRRLYDREHHLSQHDRMTGALQKEIFEERARALLEATARSRDTLLLAILDLDDFKALNTQYGHAAGDKVLREFSRGAAHIIGRGDHFGRIGGDEFALLIRLGSTDNGPEIATRLHARLATALKSSGFPVTCSMGALVISPDIARDEAALLHTVDRLMYEVKMAGKNAVKIAHAQRATPPPETQINPAARREPAGWF